MDYIRNMLIKMKNDLIDLKNQSTDMLQKIYQNIIQGMYFTMNILHDLKSQTLYMITVGTYFITSRFNGQLLPMMREFFKPIFHPIWKVTEDTLLGVTNHLLFPFYDGLVLNIVRFTKSTATEIFKLMVYHIPKHILDNIVKSGLRTIEQSVKLFSHHMPMHIYKKLLKPVMMDFLFPVARGLLYLAPKYIITNIVGPIYNRIAPVVQKMAKETFNRIVVPIYNTISSLIKRGYYLVINWSKKILHVVKFAINKLINFVVNIKEIIANTWRKIIQNLYHALNKLDEIITAIVIRVLKPIYELLEPVVRAMIDKLMMLSLRLARFLQSAWSQFIDIAKNIVYRVIAAYNTVIRLVDKAFTAVFIAFPKFVWEQLNNKIIQPVIRWITPIIDNFLQMAWNSCVNMARKLYQGLNKLSSLAEKTALYVYDNVIVPMVIKLINIVKPIISKVMDVLNTIVKIPQYAYHYLIEKPKEIIDRVARFVYENRKDLIMLTMAVVFFPVTLSYLAYRLGKRAFGYEVQTYSHQVNNQEQVSIEDVAKADNLLQKRESSELPTVMRFSSDLSGNVNSRVVNDSGVEEEGLRYRGARTMKGSAAF